MASQSCIPGKPNGNREEPGKEGRGATLPFPCPSLLFVPQRFDRIEPGGTRGGIQSESDAGEGRGGEGREN